jgi:Ca2+-binding EF-hand superfamily protein
MPGATSPKCNLTGTEIEQAKKLFLEIDLDHSGTIDQNELASMFKKMSYDLSDGEIVDVMWRIDQDRDGVISFTEFLRAVALKKVMDTFAETDERDVVAAFEECGGNSDKSGTVDTEKVAKVLGDFGISVDTAAVFSQPLTFDQFSAFFTDGSAM